MVSGSRKISLLGAELCPSLKRGTGQPRADTAFWSGVGPRFKKVGATPVKGILPPLLKTRAHVATLPHDKLGSHLHLLTTPRNPTEPNRNP